MINFAPPRIDEKTIEAVAETLRSGWITTGPKTKLLEKKLSEYCGVQQTLCLNSATAGLELALRWFGVGPGDEVIVPAYTYAATANVVIHCGATPILVDVTKHDFCISIEAIEKAITSKTKVIMPVDFGGLPCDYDAVNTLVKKVKNKFVPANEHQQKLGRVMVLSDAAHSLGAIYKGRSMGQVADISVFSFHAVKNLTTAEGGAMLFNLPAPFDNATIYKDLSILSLHGQTKDAMAKMQKGNWKYDIVEAGFKCNMTDLAATIGLIELERYKDDTLPKRKAIVEAYDSFFSKFDWAELPVS
ncbi:MAG TPA: DegT/DnrJ/EryC1/StrS aminotransferase family protein, partial [Bacteroidia bacterium]|nr:DegT/DnrJ/EryC1/StrS aminotransferase family protein [Bacteroidia bacterium]